MAGGGAAAYELLELRRHSLAIDEKNNVNMMRDGMRQERDGFAHLHDLVQSVVGMTNEELFDW